MGLTRSSTGRMLKKRRVKTDAPACPTVALVGNPNVGKSTLFNALTGLRQHTGNWTGKTVENAEGFCVHRGRRLRIVDMPGVYSLSARSPEERIACEYLCSDRPDAVVIVCDACMPERSLLLAMQLIRRNPNAIVCMNLMDEAKKRGRTVRLDRLSELLGVRTVGISARDREGLSALLDAVLEVIAAPKQSTAQGAGSDPAADYRALEGIAAQCVRAEPNRRALDREASDRFLMKRWVSLPIAAALLALVFWLTLEGANLPSRLLADGLFRLEALLHALAVALRAPAWLEGILLDGMFRTLAWVISVMLPPMAIFFPLFTLMEDAGLLPRIAFGMDHSFAGCRACGKQALTICMGFGCNAAGVVGCRIIESKRERIIAAVTNAMVPCNGRFPALLTVLTVLSALIGLEAYGAAFGAIGLTATVLFAVLMTLAASWLLGHTLPHADGSVYILEIPPLRMPKLGQVLVRSLLDRTLYVLGRAAAIAAPCGALLWTLANVRFGSESVLLHATGWLDPLARAFGLDGTILLSFLLGSPANEIVLPIASMIYQNGAVLSEPAGPTALASLFAANGWTAKTCVCFLVFTVLHWPCATTLWTIRRETGSRLYTLLALLLPTCLGLLLCFLINLFCLLFGI